MKYTTHVTTPDGSETVAKQIVDDEKIPYPPHRWLAGVVATLPVVLDEESKEVGLEDRIAALVPTRLATATSEQYLEHLSATRSATLMMLTLHIGVAPVDMSLTWFVLRETTGEGEDRVAHYTPANGEELQGWLDAETFSESQQAEIAFGGAEA